MTFDEWKATRTPCEDVGDYLGDDSSMGMPGYIYADFMFIAAVESKPDTYWTIAERDEVEGSLDMCERWLWENFADRELNQ